MVSPKESPPPITLKLMGKLKCPIGKLRGSLRKQWHPIERIGVFILMMLSGPTAPHTRPPLGCPHTDWFSVKDVISRWSWNTRPGWQFKNAIWRLTRLEISESCKFMSYKKFAG